MSDKTPADETVIAALDQARKLHAEGKLDEAAGVYEGLLSMGDNPDAQHGLALIWHQTGRNVEAIPVLENLLEHDPGAVSSRLVLARCLADTGKISAAIEHCNKACELLPGNPAVWNLAGWLQQQAGNPMRALNRLERALIIDPAFGPAQHNQGISLATLGRHDAAILAYEGALRAMPAAARVYFNYALALEAAGREERAISALSRALDLRPGMVDARLRLLHLRLLLCDWRELDAQTKIVTESLNKLLAKQEIGHLSLLVLNLIEVPASLHRELARRMARGIASRAQTISRPREKARSGDGRIRLGYVSPDIGIHAVGGLLQDLFACHDAEKFEVCVFNLRTFNDPIASAIRARSEKFMDLVDLSTAEAAQKIADFGPDILIDLGGYTLGARTELLAMRLAPLQISWLGYLNTMGAEFIDYLIADEVVISAEDDGKSEDNYDEKIARLPRCFLPFSKLADDAPSLGREEVGLPENAVVLASFNNPAKIQPAEFRAWIKILRRAPQSVLWVFDGGREAVRKNLRAALEMAKLDPGRMIFASMLPMNEHMQRMALADLFLDTFRYNAGATAIAAAQAALPVLTLKGDSILARMGASINHELDLDELVCSSTDEYIERAVELVGNPEKLHDMRNKISRAHENRTGLFDTAGFVADLERLLVNISGNA